MQSLVGRKTTHVLERMQKAVLSATLNIASFRHPDYDFHICIYI